MRKDGKISSQGHSLISFWFGSLSLSSKECGQMFVLVIDLIGIKKDEAVQVALVNPEIGFQVHFSTFSNVMGLPKREENKETCMGDHDLCQDKTTQWTNGRTEARQGHRISIEKDIY